MRNAWKTVGVVLVSAVVAALVACSSSSGGSASDGLQVACTTNTTAGISGVTSCACHVPTGGSDTRNDTACGTSTFNGDAVCYLGHLVGSGSPACGCNTMSCVKDVTANTVTCGGYGAGGVGSGVEVDESQCTGAHYCYSGIQCTCGSAACAAGTQELSSCTDSTAKGKLMAAAASMKADPGYISIVDDCRASVASAGPVGGSSSSGSSGSSSSGSGSSSGGSSSGSSSGGWGSPATCQTGAATIYECCALGGGTCQTPSQYQACCENSSCASGKVIACLAGYMPTDVNVCNAALAACM